MIDQKAVKNRQNDTKDTRITSKCGKIVTKRGVKTDTKEDS